jgi:hypothetical protein
MPSPRTLSEDEFNAIKARVLSSLPDNLTEAEFNRAVGPRLEAALGEAENSSPAVEGGAVGRFLSNAVEMLNPVSMVKGVYGAVAHPLDTASNIIGAQTNEARTAYDAAQQGDYGRAIGHGLAAITPLVGPAAAQAGEQIASGDIAGGLGKGVGLVAPFGAAPAARMARGAVPAAVAGRIAQGLEDSAAGRVVDVMAPKVGANKTRFGGMAEKVAPELLARGEAGAWSREGLHDAARAGLARGEEALDAASDSRLAARSVETQPIINELMKKRAALTAEAVEGSQPERTAVSRTSPILDDSGKPITVTDMKSSPIGKDVVPGPNADRVGAIDKAIGELRALGPVTRYGPLRTIRMAWDGPAKIKYNPSMTADFLKNQGFANGAADVTGVIRENLAKLDPETAAANSEYSLYKTATDVMDATAEIERVRPRVGRQIMARLTGSVVGGQAAGATGAVGGFILGPVLDSVLSSGATTKLQTAQLMSKLAKAIRAGDQGYVNSLSVQLQSIAKRASVANQVGRTTSPSESQTGGAPALLPQQ